MKRKRRPSLWQIALDATHELRARKVMAISERFTLAEGFVSGAKWERRQARRERARERRAGIAEIEAWNERCAKSKARRK